MKTAIAYVTDPLLCPSKLAASKEEQERAIRRYAEANDIWILRIVEDELCTADPLERPGMWEALAAREQFDILLVESVYCVSPHWSLLKPLFRDMKRRGVRLVAVTDRFDLLSQMTRREFNPDMAVPIAVKRRRASREKAAAGVRKPEGFPRTAPRRWVF